MLGAVRPPARPLTAAFLRGGLQGFQGSPPPLALAAVPRLRSSFLPIGYSEKALHVKGRHAVKCAGFTSFFLYRVTKQLVNLRLVTAFPEVAAGL